MPVTVVGATGNTGRVVAERLLSAGMKVRGFARSANKLAALTKAGAQPLLGDATQAADLTRAFRGSEAVYLMIPPLYGAPDLLAHYEKVGSAAATAVVESGVKRVVFLSSLGGQLPEGTGPIKGLHAVEERLKKIRGLDLLLLRPGYFYENFLGSLGLIKSQNVNGSVIRPDLSMVMIAARDVAQVAANAFLTEDFTGTVVRELFGPRELTMELATKTIGKKIGMPALPYVQFPDDGFKAGLKAAGFSENSASLFLEMQKAFNDGRIVARESRKAANTGSTTFESFAAEVLAPAYAAA